jgi:hypothetical protein
MTIHRDVLSRAKVFKLTWLKGSHDTNNHGGSHDISNHGGSHDSLLVGIRQTTSETEEQLLLE